MTRFNARFLTLLLICICISVAASATKPVLRVTFLDVGQGDCALVRTKTKNILIDAGDDRYDSGTAVVIPYLKKEGIKKLDVCVISHPHRDHFGGFIEVLQAIKVDKVYYSNDHAAPEEKSLQKYVKKGQLSSEAKLYAKLKQIIKDKNIAYVKAKVGDKLEWGPGVKVDVFHAEAEKADEPNKRVNQNNNSIIMKVAAGDISYLFTGDAEKEAEEWTVEHAGNKLKCTVLKSGHHGSKTSSTHVFLEKVRPKFAVISVGAHNSFGHPSPSTLDKYTYYGIKYFRTDQDGTVDSYTDGKALKFITKTSPLELTENVKLISLTANSATFRWKTNKPSTSEVYYGVTTYSKKKISDYPSEVHTITLTNLSPNKKYMVRVVSTDPRENDKFVEFKSSITTKEGSDIPMPSIGKMATNYKKIYMRHPFKVSVPVNNPASKVSKSVELTLYHSAIDEGNVVNKIKIDNIDAETTVNAVFPTEITWLGDVELIAVLRSGKAIIDTASLKVNVEAKMFMVDCSHGNIDYYKGRFSGMKMNLFQKLGFKMKSISSSITYTKIKDAFVVAIPSPTKDFKASERAALAKFVSEGGSLMMFSRADYKDYSKPAFLNKILDKVGSKIRFNDDEVCDPTNNIGSDWKYFITNFPVKTIIPTAVKKLLFRSSCSLLNSKMTGLKASKNLHILVKGDADAYNIEVDGKGDGYIYASHTPKLPIPVVACEDLGVGRVACIGEKLYDDSLYGPKSTLQTPLFNQSIVHWLSLGKEKNLKELFSYTNALFLEPSPVVRSMRMEQMNKIILNRVRSSFNEDPSSKYRINDMLKDYNSPTMQPVKSKIKEMIKFDSMYGE